MIIRSVFLLAFPALLAACSGGRNATISDDKGMSSAPGAAPVDIHGNWYKRFSGTLAGKAIVVQLHRYNGQVQGSYQYTAISQTIQLVGWEDTLKDPAHPRLTEMVAQSTMEGDPAEGAVWMLNINGAEAGGSWTKGKVHDTISLHEDYPGGSTQLAAFYNIDSAALHPDKPASPHATSAHSYLLPRGREGFLSNALRAQLWPDSREADNADTLIRAGNRRYFEDYRNDNNAVGEPDGEPSDDYMLQYTSEEIISVLYNDNGWLVTEDFNSSYTGGAHGNYGASFANIDGQQQRVWKIMDVLSDTTALRPLLAQAVIEYFGIRPGDRMDERLLVDNVPPTDNFYLSATGLTMVYNPYEIASYADGQIRLFLPFRKIMPLLTPAFRARMGLSGKSGVASNAARQVHRNRI